MSIITGGIVGEIWRGMTWGGYVGGVVLAVITLRLMLNCHADKFSNATLRRIRIFMIIIILNYSLGLSVKLAFKKENGISFATLTTAIIMLGMIIFSSVIYLKSHKLSELKRAQSSEGLSARKKLDELGCGFLLIGAIFLLWALLMISWSLAAAALIIIIIFVIVKIFKGSSWKKTKDEIP